MRQASIFFVAVLLISCAKDKPNKCFKSIGKIVFEERAAKDIRNIEIIDNINLIITQDTIENITIEAGENIIPHIITEVKDSTLFISDDNSCDWLRSYDTEVNVYISVVSLKNILYGSAGKLQTTNAIITDTFTLNQWEASGEVNLKLDVHTCFLNQHTGSANLICSGTSTMTYLYTTLSSPMNCFELNSKQAFVSNLGIADIEVAVKEKLTGFIHNSGNIFYKGSPNEVIKNISGSGVIGKGE